VCECVVLNLKILSIFAFYLQMKKIIFFLVFIFFIIEVTYSQSFRVPKNVISTSLFQPFSQIGGYTLSYERIIDPGYSSNASQFSFKLNTTFISSTKREEYTRINSQVFYDEDAYKYTGYFILPELKYYFTWDAPIGAYISLFINYTDYNEVYNNINNVTESYEKNISELGRGIGAGFQFNIINNSTVDVIMGYNPKVVNSKTKDFGSSSYSSIIKSKEDKIYFNINLGFNF